MIRLTDWSLFRLSQPYLTYLYFVLMDAVGHKRNLQTRIRGVHTIFKNILLKILISDTKILVLASTEGQRRGCVVLIEIHALKSCLWQISSTDRHNKTAKYESVNSGYLTDWASKRIIDR